MKVSHLRRVWWILSTLLAAMLMLSAAAGAAQAATAQAGQRTAAPSAQTGAASHTGTIPIAEFSRIVQDFSEEGGYFFSDNFTSNETAYLYILSQIKQQGATGGAYVGVGPEQNFTYIAKVRPEIAFIVDIRRQAILQHLMYKAVFELAPDRTQFLALLLSRPLRGAKAPGKDTSIDDVLKYMDSAATSQSIFDTNLTKIETTIAENFHFPLSAQDRKDLGYVYKSFWQSNLDISFRMGTGPGNAYGGGFGDFPTLTDLILATDQNGQKGNFLASEDDYQFVRKLQMENRVIPVVGDFAGPRALAAVGDYLKKNGYTLTLFYGSNVEMFLFQEGVYSNFADNLRHMPINNKSLILRSVRSQGYMRTASLPGHRFVPLLEFLTVFFQDFDKGVYRSYYDLVTTHDITASQQ